MINYTTQETCNFFNYLSVACLEHLDKGYANESTIQDLEDELRSRWQGYLRTHNLNTTMSIL